MALKPDISVHAKNENESAISSRNFTDAHAARLRGMKHKPVTVVEQNGNVKDN